MRGAPEENWHHNVPSSRGGSDLWRNRSRPRKARHDQFHVWAWNYPPDTLFRLLAVHGACNPGSSLPAGALRDLLGKLSEGEWETFYEPSVLLPLPQRLRGKPQEFLCHHLHDEQEDLRRVLRTLTLGAAFPWEREVFSVRALAFCGVRTIRDTLVHLLTERHGHDLSWVKAFRTDVRNALEHLLLSAAPASLPEEQKMIDVLQEYECCLKEKVAML